MVLILNNLHLNYKIIYYKDWGAKSTREPDNPIDIERTCSKYHFYDSCEMTDSADPLHDMIILNHSNKLPVVQLIGDFFADAGPREG